MNSASKTIARKDSPTAARPKSAPQLIPSRGAAAAPAARLSPELAGPDTLLQLQRQYGNQATRHWLATSSTAHALQREGEEAEAAEPAAPAGPLGAAEVATALKFYQQQAQKYTPAIISQIQEKIGTPATGAMSEADVQAVAVHQQRLNETESPPLTVDGMAGPRSLPTLFPEGLADQGQIESFSAEAREVIDQWAELGTAEARIRKLVAKVNEYLTAAGVPTCDPLIDNAAGNLGQFDFTTWSLNIGKPAFEKADPTPAEKADMADTIYHESRHAEQWFRMAQIQASQGKSAKQIAKDMSIPKNIAEKAKAAALEKGSMEALIAEGWNESVYGAQGQKRNQILNELSASGKALEKAQAKFNAHPTAANQKKLDAANARRQKALAAYYNLPEENDANRIGGRVTAAYMAGEPTPEEAPEAP